MGGTHKGRAYCRTHLYWVSYLGLVVGLYHIEYLRVTSCFNFLKDLTSKNVDSTIFHIFSLILVQITNRGALLKLRWQRLNGKNTIQVKDSLIHRRFESSRMHVIISDACDCDMNDLKKKKISAYLLWYYILH